MPDAHSGPIVADPPPRPMQTETAAETAALPVETDRPAPGVLMADVGRRDGFALDRDDARFVYHLHFEHLRNLTTLAVSATGGGLIALQAGLLDYEGGADLDPAAAAIADLVPAFPLLCFAFAAVLSFLTQRPLIRDLALSGEPSKAFAWMSEVSSGFFGAGVGSAAVILLWFGLL